MKKKFALGICVMLVIASARATYAQNTCPPGLPPDTTCYSGADANGAYYLIAVPSQFNGDLVLWNHGYDLATPRPLTAGDLGPASAALQFGFAAAASSYRPDAIGIGGWAVADGAQDTENLRQLFVNTVRQPGHTYALGASEGGLVTATGIELYARDDQGNLNYHGAMPLCGPLAGGVRNWWGGYDLRVVYQYYCRNLPRPDEPDYPLYLGMDPNNPIDPDELGRRVNACTGVLLPKDQRSQEQQANLANILGVTRIPESFLLIDMGFATFGLQELVQVRTGGLPPVTDLGVVYDGSSDDDALNKGVFRSGSDPSALTWLRTAYDPTGAVLIPTFTLHTKGDGLVVVENENAYRQTREAAGTAGNLFQMYTNAGGHCEFSPNEATAAFIGLRNWVQTGTRPTAEQVVTTCLILGGPCNFDTSFQPDDFSSRVRDRDP